MCGLAGAINNNISEESINRVLRHRGPDQQAGYTFNNVSLFHLRLAILDISGGKQPMHLDDKYTIIFNGEIYNHQEIRQQFNITGNTTSDTETLLLLYERFGTEFLHLLDGMFAFVILDKVKNKLFIARDRAGKKPFYYYHSSQKFVFASELNCLKTMTPVVMHERAFYPYLRLGYFYKSNTPYKDVHELQPGSYVLINCNDLQLTSTKWWNINDYYKSRSSDTFEQSLENVDRHLHTAIKRRLESSDLEVGCFLSGGIDSGLAAAIASGYNSRLKTFTVSFDDTYDEAPLAKLVADKYQTDHTEIKISFTDLTNDLENIIANYGEPFFDSSAIPSYYVSREAKKYLTVILNGDGADELFGGYRRYVPFSKYDFFKGNRILKYSARALHNILPHSNNKKSKYNYAYRLASFASKSTVEMYLSAGSDIFEDFEYAIKDPGYDYLEEMRNDFTAVTESKLSGLQKIMNLDFDTNLPGDLLVKMDIATMASSLEGRSPFLSKELLEYVPSINDKYKINGSTTKYLLRTLAKKYLPAELINQPKRGFEIPLKSWVNNELQDMIFYYLNASNCLNKQFIDQSFLKRLMDRKVNVPEEKRAKILWNLLSMEVWYKKVYLHE